MFAISLPFQKNIYKGMHYKKKKNYLETNF